MRRLTDLKLFTDFILAEDRSALLWPWEVIKSPLLSPMKVQEGQQIRMRIAAWCPVSSQVDLQLSQQVTDSEIAFYLTVPLLGQTPTQRSYLDPCLTKDSAVLWESELSEVGCSGMAFVDTY